MTQDASKLLTAGGAQAKAEAGNQLAVTGDLGRVLDAALKDSDAMFNNRDMELSSRYGIPGKEALFVWWSVLREMHKDLYRNQRFKEGDMVTEVVQKGVEAAYNFFGIVPETVGLQGRHSHFLGDFLRRVHALVGHCHPVSLRRHRA